MKRKPRAGAGETLPGPKYRAYQPVKLTDDLVTWTRHKFDGNNGVTADDIAEFGSIISGRDPQSRIDDLKARISALTNISPTMQLHIDAMRKILEAIPHPFPEGEAEFDRLVYGPLTEAHRYWDQIMTQRGLVPLARKGAKFAAGKPKGSTGLMRKFVRELLARGDNANRPARELWDDVCAAMPKARRHGIEFYDTHAWLPDGKEVTYERFENIVSEERKGTQ